MNTDARAMRVYRDELDALREKAMRADKLESEVGRYRDKLHSMEFYRAKVEELKEDNQVLLETKTMLEEQLEGSRARSDKLHQLEKHNLQLQAKIHNMEENADQKRIEELLEDNFVLEIAQKRSIEESLHLGWELEQLSKSSQESEGPVQKSLDAEVTEKACSQMLRLERENQRLLTTLEELRRTSDPSVECRHDTLKQVEEVKEEDACINKTFSLDMIQSNTQDKLKISFPKHMDVPDSTDNKELIEQEMQHVTLWRNVGFMGLDVQINKHLKEKDAMQEKMDSSKVEQPESADYLKQKEKGSLDLLCGILDSYHPKVQRDAGTQEQNSLVQHAQCPVSCHALDAENKQLLTALENASRRLRRLEAELWDLECEKQALRGSLEELRIGDRCLEQLEADSKALKQEALQLERDKGRLEKENRRLRQRVEIQEATLDSNSLSLAGLEKENRALGKELEALKECNARVKELENESRDLLKQAAIDQKTLTALQEDMVSEKLKMQNKDKELEKLTRELEKMGLNEQQLLSDQRAADDSRYKQLESDLESSLKRCVEIKEEKMTVLESRLKETSALNQQLRQELRTVKQNYEAMLQREEEDWLSHGDIGGLRAWQKESQEATRELLRVKDHLIEVERNVEKSTLTSQSASLMAQNIQLQGQQCSLEGERESAVRDREDLRKVNELLLRDHERLTALHERQAAEYESLISKHRGLKNSHRRLELEHHALEDRHNTLLQQKSQLEELERTLKVEQQQMLQEKDKHRSTAAECQRLRDEKDWLDQSYQQLLKENESLQAEHKNTKCLLNTMKLDQMRLESELSNFKEQYQQLDITSTKLTNQCELLTQLKRNLEEENRHLLQQIQTLMLQIRNLLEHTMESKDLFHVEQRQYIDKLNELRRQKEKLEEKIMDQYKFYESSPTKRRGNWITLKMKKLMKTKSREQEKERGRSHVETHCEGSRGHDNSSCGGSQDSAESASNSMDDSLSPKRSSSEYKCILLKRQKDGRATGSKGVQSQNLRRTESARVTRVTKGSCSHSTSRPGDKSSSASSCLDCFSTPLRRGGHGSRGGNGPCSTLPRSSSVISTSEGSSRRASFHSMISRSATASPRKNNIDESRDKESDQIPSPSAHQSASELEAPGLTERPDGADVRCPEPPFRPLFTIDSVFSNTIFGEPSLKSQVQTSFSLDSSHDHKISGVQVKKQAEPVSLDKQENQKSGEQDFSVNESVTSVYHSLSDLSSTKAENEMN
uniref:Girdin n=1 Tax=Denticeps clupeoides TaxID=299321 RepID=A0AAY4EVZ8_9TELE